MKTIALLLALVVTGPAWGQLADDTTPLTVYPSEGKAMGYVEAEQPGKWVVLGEGFMPVPFRTVNDAKGIVFEAESGTYGVLYFPPGDEQPKVARVVLGKVTPKPDPDPDDPPDDPDEPSKADAATYVFEKDEGAIPPPVRSALNKLLRDGIEATVFERNGTDGDGDIPEQYEEVLSAAKDSGLPCLVVSGGGKVLKVVDDPQSEDDVMGALK